MRIEDVKIGMRVKYEYDGEVACGVVKRVNRPSQTCDAKVRCDWEEKGSYLGTSPEHISPAEENTPKFKVGDKVVVVDELGGLPRCHKIGDILTVKYVEKGIDPANGCYYTFNELPYGLYERRIELLSAPSTEPKKIAEEIAPELWNAYKDTLNDEALAALRQVIEDVDNHEKLNFRDRNDINASFRWDETSQGCVFWDDVYEGKYDKYVSVVSNPETNLSYTVSTYTKVLDKDMECTGDPCLGIYMPDGTKVDTGSAATKSDGGSSDYYKVPIKLPKALFDSEGNKVESITFEMQDIIYAVVGGEWTLGNILKATRRMYLASRGSGKAGVDVEYDKRKIIWFCEDFARRFGNDQR